ncbi:hypothetical protein G5I_06613 [Acromyrmex echinatior]|uniref:Uncharacterized protein n=1 Tax=Acromyrmex echinatior TaxID=103372 RepID=F4WLI6_ACREC|nr:hypothetical protein G5I_06613 [Acromyrmex echinatior]
MTQRSRDILETTLARALVTRTIVRLKSLFINSLPYGMQDDAKITPESIKDDRGWCRCVTTCKKSIATIGSSLNCSKPKYICIWWWIFPRFSALCIEN